MVSALFFLSTFFVSRPSCPDLQARVAAVLPSLPPAFGDALSFAAARCTLSLDAAVTFFAVGKPSLPISHYIASDTIHLPQGQEATSVPTLAGNIELWSDDGVWVAIDDLYAVLDMQTGDGWTVYTLSEAEPADETVEIWERDTDIDLEQPAADTEILKGGSSGGGGRGGGSSGSKSSSSSSSKGSTSGWTSSSGSSSSSKNTGSDTSSINKNSGTSDSSGVNKNSNTGTTSNINPAVPYVVAGGGTARTGTGKKNNTAIAVRPAWTLPIAVLAALAV